MKKSQKTKRCFSFCYRGVIGDKKAPTNVKSHNFELERFFVKENNAENIARTENERSSILF